MTFLKLQELAGTSNLFWLSYVADNGSMCGYSVRLVYVVTCKQIKKSLIIFYVVNLFDIFVLLQYSLLTVIGNGVLKAGVEI
jgi:hypothetical protein